jgi:hypothetical protein
MEPRAQSARSRMIFMAPLRAFLSFLTLRRSLGP